MLADGRGVVPHKGTTSMAKFKIFITSSGRTRVLAEKLRDTLTTDYKADLWNKVSKDKPSETRIEMLEEAAREYDFAVVILARDDVTGAKTDDTLKARDNCIFEAGLFMAAIGRKRCFLVNSVEQSDLPSDLGGIISLPFKEPDNLESRDECGEAMTEVGGKILDILDRVQKGPGITNRPLSRHALLEREKKTYDGGDLGEDQVVVASMQPLEVGYESALQVRNNIESNIRYVYFFQGSDDGAAKTCHLLQLVLLARILGNKTEADNFRTRREKVELNRDRIVDELNDICVKGTVKIYFLPASPDLQYCIHNATDQINAKLYLKHRDEFIEWESGEAAFQFWRLVKDRQGIADPQPPYAVLYGALGLKLREGAFFRALKNEVGRYFPGIEEKVMSLCLDGPE